MACRCIDEEIHPDVDGSLSAVLCSVLCDIDETIVTRKVKISITLTNLHGAKSFRISIDITKRTLQSRLSKTHKHITKVKIRYYLRAKMAFKISLNWPSGFFVTKPKVATRSRAYRQRQEEFFMGHVYLTSLD
ncbi:hypothetical protein HZH66_002155 [Vespula vulgaris]|uniref:Uncharacterized protein n=1 Tax=Vespula vulgaris TaxID=7454 RepID=A0A834KJD2_VESVU|nr:hypothetical protein HZH66_002155 [Vespula vulgaris]